MDTSSKKHAPLPINFQYFRSPRTVIARFVAKRTLKSAVVTAFIFGVYFASKTIGFVKAYPTVVGREKFAHSFGNNTGMNALLGTPHNLGTISGYANWNVLGVVTIMGAIWALLLATRYFRGEEEAGRTDLLLTGHTTASRAAFSTLVGLSADLLLFFVIVAVLFIGVGKYQGIGFTTGSSLFFALASVASAAFFLAVGAITSQLMPTRTRATTVGVVVFGLSFILRAAADTTNAHWLLNITPLGWIEKLQPLVGSQPIWLLPTFASTFVLFALAVWIASQRDVGDSVFADRNTAKPRTGLLRSPFLTALRLTGAQSVGWLTAITAMAYLYGSLTKSVIQAFNGEGKGGVHKVLKHLTSSGNVSFATIFLGAIFLLLMAAVMGYVASAMGKVRGDEADGYVDNFLVQPVSRYRWLGGRVLLVTIVGLLACLLASLGIWAGEASQHVGIPIHELLEAGANMTAPILFTLGATTLVMGIAPRFTSLVGYCVLGWSFLVTLLASGGNLSHWILDTSLLHQTTLAPAVAPNWSVNTWMIAIGLGLCAIGMLAFQNRDLESD
ncbi:MAG TPA: ABC transporter permease subunit [Verrucomicrobiae bacterium]|nr:ABC transporter permease subunit [Verrucomicrobiae bacterium]